MTRAWASGIPAHRPLAFLSGASILVLEVVGARLIADTYGLSSIPWTVVIATVLTGFALGNAAGGVGADRGTVKVSTLFLGAAIWSALTIPAMDLPNVLVFRVGFLPGAVGSAAFFFLVPSTLMGAVTPALVTRQTKAVEEVGERFGDVGAWSTAGAIVGTLLGGYLLLPGMGIPAVLALVAVVLLLGAAVASQIEGSRGRLVGSLALVPVAGALALAPGLAYDRALFSTQSLYASLRVVDSEWYDGVPARELWQNGSLSSVEHRETGQPLHYYQITIGWLLDDRIERIGSVLQLGGAAQTLPAQLVRWAPDLDLTVVEIDPVAVEVARAYFSFGLLPPDAIDVVVQDARPFLSRDAGRYDVILSDAYDNLYSVPWPLMTVEAFRDMDARLAEGGMIGLTISTALEGPGAAFLQRLMGTLGEVFPDVRAYLSRPDQEGRMTQEVIVVAVRDPAHFPKADIPWVVPPSSGPPLRDDYAPVEFLQAVRFFYDPEW